VDLFIEFFSGLKVVYNFGFFDQSIQLVVLLASIISF
jgi:hypothetical protein